MNINEKYESAVRSYCRSFPAVFDTSKGAKIYTKDKKEYIDFFAGAGTLNYGHNNDYIKKCLIDHLMNDKITHALDMYTEAKVKFIETFVDKILKPRNLDYKIMFCGATGTNAVEASLKLARKNKKRINVFAFMGAFHGMTLGALAATSGLESRAGASFPLTGVTFMPFPTGCNADFDTINYIENILKDDHSGIEKPAAIIVETVQAEGGIFVAPIDWLKRLEKLCKENDILLIVDDIQVGCGRTGSFFSFERAGINPDMVVLSKSISGYGLPMSLALFKPELDIWSPAEHNGTFRGNQMAFSAATAAIEYREIADMDNETLRKGKIVSDFITKEILPLDNRLELRGIGLIWGIECAKISDKLSKKVMQLSFENGLILERAGRNDSVVKLLPPLVIEDDVLLKGLEILKGAFIKAL